MGKYIYVRDKKTKAHQPGHWSEQKKIQAVTTWLLLGNLPKTAMEIGVPIHTLENWRKSDWWKEMVEKIQSEDNQALDSKMSKVIDKAIEHLMDRVENGDYYYDSKTGRLKRRPATLRDINTALNSVIDKRQLLRKLPTKITASSNTDQKLQQLAQQFADFAQKTLPKQEDKFEYFEGENVVQNADGVYELKE